MSPPSTANLTPEAAARIEIDRQLEQSGWVIQEPDAMNIYAARGVAVREVKLKKGHGKVGGAAPGTLIVISSLGEPA